VQAITGHKTRAMAAKYGKGASQRRLAREARGRRNVRTEQKRKVWWEVGARRIAASQAIDGAD